MVAADDKTRYAEFLHSGPLKRVYVDIPESAHAMLGELARKNGVPMKAQLTLLIADAVEKPKRASKKKPTVRSKKRGKKKTRNRKKK